MSTSANGQSPELSENAPATSLRKKRVACDNCHLSKVRCTGEIKGCQRCRRGQKTCHYSESNMGRKPSAVSSIRPTTKQEMGARRVPDTLMAAAHNWSPANSIHSTSEHRGQFYSSNQNNQKQEQQELGDSFEALPLEPFDSDLPNFNPDIAAPDELNLFDIDDNYFHVTGYALGTTLSKNSALSSQEGRHREQQQQQQQQQQQHHHYHQQQQIENIQLSEKSLACSARNYNGVSHGVGEGLNASSTSSSNVSICYWAAQLEALSLTPRKSPIPLDSMLQHSSQVLPRVLETLCSLDTPASQTDCPSSSSPSLILILICLTQVIALFEECLPSVIEDTAGSNSSNTLGRCSDQLSLHLGQFQIDAETQGALQAYIVGKELRTILQTCKLVRQILAHPAWRSALRQTHDLLLEDLRLRTLALIYQMKQRRAVSSIFSV